MRAGAQDPVLLIRKFFASRDEFWSPKEGWALVVSEAEPSAQP